MGSCLLEGMCHRLAGGLHSVRPVEIPLVRRDVDVIRGITRVEFNGVALVDGPVRPRICNGIGDIPNRDVRRGIRRHARTVRDRQGHVVLASHFVHVGRPLAGDGLARIEVPFVGRDRFRALGAAGV